jgi:hypothetical protein
VVNKLLKKLGLSGESIARPGARGQQNDRHYQVSGWNNPIRIRLLEAMHRRLSESVSTICNQELISLQVVDTSKQNPKNPREWESAESLADVRMWLDAAEVTRMTHQLHSCSAWSLQIYGSG